MRMLKIFYLKKSKERHYSNLYSKTGLLNAEYRVSYLERKQVFVGHISPKITTYSKIKSFHKSRQNHFPLLWKNNNYESIHGFKDSEDWSISILAQQIELFYVVRRHAKININ